MADKTTTLYSGFYQGPASDPLTHAQNAINRAFEKGQQLQQDLDTSADITASDGESIE